MATDQSGARAQTLPPGWVAALHDPALAEEFWQAPFGPYSQPLRRLLAVMRNGPVAHKPVIIIGDDGQVWLAELPERFGEPLIPCGGPYAAIGEEVERDAFALRWRTMFGEAPPW